MGAERNQNINATKETKNENDPEQRLMTESLRNENEMKVIRKVKAKRVRKRELRQVSNETSVLPASSAALTSARSCAVAGRGIGGFWRGFEVERAAA